MDENKNIPGTVSETTCGETPAPQQYEPVETPAPQQYEPGAQPAAPAAAKVRRPIRHMIWAVCFIALGLVFGGEITGTIGTDIITSVFRITDGPTLFLFMYLAFIGIDAAVLVFTFFCERPVFRTFGLRAKGGRGNTWGMFGLGLLVGFGMNALCILAAWLNGDIVLLVCRRSRAKSAE